MTNNHYQSDNTRGGERVGDFVSIFVRGHRWYANFQLDGKQIRQSLKTRSKKEARRRAIRLEAEISEGRYARAKKPTSIEAVAAAYLGHLRTEGRAKKTLQKCELVVKRVLDLAARRKAGSIGDVDLAFVDAYRAERAVPTKRLKRGARAKTLLNETVIIRQLVNFALSRRMITNDPLHGLKLKKVKSGPQPCWTRAEVDKILAAAKAPHKPALVLLAETGCRVGEIKWLTWDDVDLEHGLIHIRPKDDWKPKTGDQRAIPMNPAARSILEELPRKSRWVVTTAPSAKFPARGRQISERRLLQYLKRILKRLGLRGHLHTFRHSFISHALTNGIPEAIVRQWVGHVDDDVLKLYTHVADQVSQSAMKRLSQINEVQPQGKEAEDVSIEAEANPAQSQHKPQEKEKGESAKQEPPSG